MKFSTIISYFQDKISSLRKSSNANSRFKILAYNRVVSKLILISEENVTDKKISSLDITDNMKSKIHNVFIKGYKKTNDNSLLFELESKMGLGKKKAQKLIDEGLKKISDLNKAKFHSLLPYETQVYIKYCPKERIKRSDVEDVEKKILTLSDKILSIVFVGSYRREKETIGDIDIMLIVNDDNLSQAIDIFMKRLEKIYNEVIIYSKGKEKASFLIKISDGKYYKIDTFAVSNKDQHDVPFLLYSTGSKEHNIKMRRIAKSKGYLLNQHGLYLNSSYVKGLKNEKDYFNILGMKYLKPSER